MNSPITHLRVSISWFLGIALALAALANVAWAKQPPPGVGSANVPANILIMLDTSGSMSESVGTTTSLSYPFSVAVDSSGNVYVADTYNHRVQKFNSAGVFQAKWGTVGSGNGQFMYPFGIAVDAGGNVYVADYGNHRVQKFNSAGVFQAKWGTVGSGNGQFLSPLGIAVDAGGNVYVADTYNHRVQKFNSAGVFQTKWGTLGSGNGQFNGPIGIAVDAGGNVYVADTYNDRVQKFNSAGVFLAKWGTFGSGNGQFMWPTDIAVDAGGNVYVADTYNHRVQKFNSAGVFQAKWGTLGSGNGQFNGPIGIAVDAGGNVYVADTYNDRVQKFDGNGGYLQTFGKSRTRLELAKEVIKKIVTDPGLTSGAYFGLMDWNSTARMRVNVGSGGAAAIYTEVDRLVAGGGTILDSAMTLANSYLSGPGSPINPSLGCQRTILIVISDGDWSDRQASKIAENLYKSRGIQTWVIGFAGYTNTANYVRLSQMGGTYPASPLYAQNYQELYEQLTSAIRAAIDSRLTFTAPVIMPGVGGTDALYQSSFDYKKDHQWQGHFIKYALNPDGGVGDKLWDAGAILNSTAESSRKIWSPIPGLSNAGYDNFTEANRSQLKRWLYENAGYDPTDTQLTKLVRFIRGVDAYDENINGNTSESRWKLADIYHSEAVVVGPPAAPVSTLKEDALTESYYRGQNGYAGFKSAKAGRPTIVYVGANDGMLHAFDAQTGAERWAFIPPPLLPALRGMVSARANSSNSIYGVDGSPTVADVFYGGRWRTVLVSGLGYGGKGYFALDITDANAPEHLFSFSHDPMEKLVHYWDATGIRRTSSYLSGSIPPEFDFSRLGDAWSKPVILPMPYLGGHRWVVAIGGGYSGGAKTGYGSAMYVLDLENAGQVMKRIDLADDAASDIGNGVVPMLTAVSAEGTTLASYRGALLYFTDLQGKLWKINLTDTGALYRADQVFNAGATRSNDRWAFHALGSSIVLEADNAGRLYHFFGTGNQLDLQRMDNAIQNRVYGVKDQDFPAIANTGTKPSFTVTSMQDFAPPSGLGACPKPDQRGWFANLEYVRSPPGTGVPLGKHQRVTGKAAIHNKSAIFSLYQPQVADACSMGTGRLLELDYRCGSPMKITGLDKGIPTGAVVYKNRIYVGISGGSGQTPPAGWARKDNVMVGTPAAGSTTGGAIQYESWREVR